METRGSSNITVQSIDVYGIKERLRKSKTKLSKEALHLIKALEDALKRQQELTGYAISQLRKKETK